MVRTVSQKAIRTPTSISKDRTWWLMSRRFRDIHQPISKVIWITYRSILTVDISTVRSGYRWSIRIQYATTMAIVTQITAFMVVLFFINLPHLL